MQAAANIGMPEARIILAEAALYVALSPKSNCAYLAIDNALADVSSKDTGEIPMHIRNAPASGMKEFGYGVGYKYPHDFPNHKVEQQYLPDKMLGTKYYIQDETVKNPWRKLTKIGTVPKNDENWDCPQKGQKNKLKVLTLGLFFDILFKLKNTHARFSLRLCLRNLIT